MNWTKLFQASSLFVLLLLANSIYPDYSSLTPEEKYRVVKAFEQSKYYPIYLALVEGKDKLEITDIKKIRIKNLTDNLKRVTYVLKIDLTIKDKVFKRVLVLEGKLLALKTETKSFWNSDFMNGLKWAGWLVAGILTVVIAI
jgi:hypothetical protein